MTLDNIIISSSCHHHQTLASSNHHNHPEEVTANTPLNFIIQEVCRQFAVIVTKSFDISSEIFIIYNVLNFHYLTTNNIASK